MPIQKIYADREYVDEKILNKISAPATASVGQVIIVKSVDENGKPIEWEAVDRVMTDDTLSIAGRPADAKVAGDSINNLTTSINSLTKDFENLQIGTTQLLLNSKLMSENEDLLRHWTAPQGAISIDENGFGIATLGSVSTTETTTEEVDT